MKILIWILIFLATFPYGVYALLPIKSIMRWSIMVTTQANHHKKATILGLRGTMLFSILCHSEYYFFLVGLPNRTSWYGCP